VTHYEVTQTVTTIRNQPYIIMTTAQFSPITTQAVQLMQLVIILQFVTKQLRNPSPQHNHYNLLPLHCQYHTLPDGTGYVMNFQAVQGV